MPVRAEKHLEGDTAAVRGTVRRRPRDDFAAVDEISAHAIVLRIPGVRGVGLGARAGAEPVSTAPREARRDQEQRVLGQSVASAMKVPLRSRPVCCACRADKVDVNVGDSVPTFQPPST